MGVTQWYDLLRRGKLSVYEEGYGFAKPTTPHRPRQIPTEALEELLLSAVLGIFWASDLRRPFPPVILTSDGFIPLIHREDCNIPSMYAADLQELLGSTGVP